jgi:hypothetical protein
VKGGSVHEKKSDIAIANFKSGFICSSAVLSTFSDELGLADETANKLPVVLARGYLKRATSAVQYQGRFLSSG